VKAGLLDERTSVRRFSRQPCEWSAVAKGDKAPEDLPCDDGPKAGTKKVPIIVPSNQEKLVFRYLAHNTAVPAAERRAAMMPAMASGRNTPVSLPHAAKTEIHVFEVGAELLVEPIQGFQHTATEQTGGTRSDCDGGLMAGGRPLLAIAGTPGATGAA